MDEEFFQTVLQILLTDIEDHLICVSHGLLSWFDRYPAKYVEPHKDSL